MAIQGFKDKWTPAIFALKSPGKGFPADLVRATQRKLVMLDAAGVLEDLRAPPSNRLEQLSGDRAGQHSIRINDQWRLCFVWTEHGPDAVEFTDYH